MGQVSKPCEEGKFSTMFRNQMPHYEVLSEEAMETLDGGWRRLLTEVGVEFLDQRALERDMKLARGLPLGEDAAITAAALSAAGGDEADAAPASAQPQGDQ